MDAGTSQMSTDQCTVIQQGRRAIAPLAKAAILTALLALGWIVSERVGELPAEARDLLPRAQPSKPSACAVHLGSPVSAPLSVILTADPGDFSGTSEAHYIIDNLKNVKIKARDSTVCGSYYQGLLMGQPVLVVTTGIGPAAAALCTLEVLSACGAHIREILYFGTSGWSPQFGGVLNPPNCQAANNNGRINRLGDVCVSPFTVNWTCKKSSWLQQSGGYPNQCYRPPEVASPNATILFGLCQFYEDNMEANLALADELLSVIRDKSVLNRFPVRSEAASFIERRYWSAMGAATQVQYPEPQPSTPPTVYDYTQCMEVDANFFYSGVPFELKARDYAAETLSAALGRPVTATEVTAITAMEGVGVSEAILKYNLLSTTKRKIPYTHIRTLSNWVHQPVKQVSPGVWQYTEELPEDFVTGYGYAIATGSATILSLYQARCLEDTLQGRLPAKTDCSYTIAYDSKGVSVA